MVAMPSLTQPSGGGGEEEEGPIARTGLVRWARPSQAVMVNLSGSIDTR